MAKLNDDEDLVLSILSEHGPCRFKAGKDLAACEALLKTGHIEDIGDAVQISAKGIRYLAKN